MHYVKEKKSCNFIVSNFFFVKGFHQTYAFFARTINICIIQLLRQIRNQRLSDISRISLVFNFLCKLPHNYAYNFVSIQKII